MRQQHSNSMHLPQPNAVVTLLRHQVTTLLRVFELEVAGHPVAAQAYVVANPKRPRPLQPAATPPARTTDTSIVYESVESYRQVEPRLRLVARLFSNLVRIGSFELDGKVAAVDGFRFKDLSFWARYPATSPLHNFGELSSRCSCRCEFCFLNGSRAVAEPRPMLTLSEAKTRARCYAKDRHLGLPTPSARPGEPFTNPHALDLLRIARSADPRQVLDLTTNGDFLTPAMADALAELQPVHIALSLNSANVDVRRAIMRSPRPERAIGAVALLEERGIQFTGSIVPSPRLLGDVAETMHYLDRHRALQIRLLLPGYTRYSPVASQFETQPFWDALVDLAAGIRPWLRAPLLIQPGFYANRLITAHIDGIFAGSPAERAGLRFGDLIVRVNDTAIATRAEACHFLEMEPRSGQPWTARVDVERNGQRLSFDLSNELATNEDCYPYKPAGCPASYEMLGRWGFGVQMTDGFDVGNLQSLKELVERHPGARRVLVFTTPLVRDLYVQAMQIVGELPACRISGVEVRVTIAPQNYWGGNIMIGDLNVVQDFIDHLNDLASLGYRPDLAIIPSSFANAWGLDVLGRSFLEIERRTGTRIELLPVRRVMV